MSSSSDAFRPLTARRVSGGAVADVPTQRSAGYGGRLGVVPTQRELGGLAVEDRPADDRTADVRPAFAAPVETAARTATAEAVPARFVPLDESAGPAAGALASYEQARAAGFSAGFAAGSREAAKVAAAEAEAAYQRAEAAEAARADEHAQAMTTLTAAVRAVCAAQVPVLEAATDRLYAAALELATAVLGVELSHAPTAARAVLARTATARVSSQVVVRMNPRDADVVVAPEGMRVVADPTLSYGDAVVEHGEGELDARIGTALERARAALAEATATVPTPAEQPGILGGEVL